MNSVPKAHPKNQEEGNLFILHEIKTEGLWICANLIGQNGGNSQ